MPLRTVKFRKTPKRYLSKEYRKYYSYMMGSLADLMVDELYVRSTRPGFMRCFLARVNSVPLPPPSPLPKEIMERQQRRLRILAYTRNGVYAHLILK